MAVNSHTNDTGSRMASPLLEFRNISIDYTRKNSFSLKQPQKITAVKNISFSVEHGESFTLIGESGSGKTSLAMAALGFVRPAAGEILFDNGEVVSASNSDDDIIRSKIQPVFQDAGASLNPYKKILATMTDALAPRRRLNKSERLDKVVELLELVGLSTEHLNRYPHQLSGGQKQRVCIARALAPDPAILILDEPFSAQDLSLQLRLICLLNDLKKNRELTYLLISHDLRVVRGISDHIAVIKSGEIIEINTSEQLYQSPEKQYTRQLLDHSALTGLNKQNHNVRIHRSE